MGHCIQAIVATVDVADAVCQLYPQLPRLDSRQGFTLLAVNADFIDTVVDPSTSSGCPAACTGDAFMLLTDGFLAFLRELSRIGFIAYIETDYFGGLGGQGAVVFANGREVMPPEWSHSGPINAAFASIGIPSPERGDRFTAMGLEGFRSNDAIVAARNSRRDAES